MVNKATEELSNFEQRLAEIGLEPPPLPKAGLGDWFSRQDELQASQIELLTQILSELKKEQQISLNPAWDMYPRDLQELANLLLNKQRTPYQVYSVANMSAAKVNLELPYQGNFISCWTDGSYGQIGVRLNNAENDLIYFNRRNPIKGIPFWKIFLNYPVQSGKKLDLLIGNYGLIDAPIPTNAVGIIQPLFELRTDKDTHFAGAINQWATEEENVTGLLTSKIVIRGVSVLSDQQLNYRAILFSRDSFADADLDVDEFVSEIDLDLLSYGFQIAGAGLYMMSVTNLRVPYEDKDETKELHVALQNKSATAKNAGATGEVVMRIFYEEQE